MSMCRTPRWATASIDRVLHGRCAADGAGLTDALGAQRVQRSRCLGAVHLEARELGGRRYGVVHEVAGQRVAVGVVDHLLVQRLADASGDATVLLALDQQRVQHGSAVVDGDVPHQGDLAGVLVDLDHGDVRTERERRLALVEVELGSQAQGAVAVVDDTVGGGRGRSERSPVESPCSAHRRRRACRSRCRRRCRRRRLRACAQRDALPCRPVLRWREAPPSHRAAANVNHRCRHRFAPDRCRRRSAGCDRSECPSDR